MEFYLFNEKHRVWRYLLSISMVPMICMGLLLFIFSVDGFASKSDAIILTSVLVGISLLWIIIWIVVIRNMGTKKHKVIIDESGIEYKSPKLNFTMEWQDIGSIAMGKRSKSPIIYIFHKSLSEDKKQDKVKTMLTKGGYTKYITEDFLFIGYYFDLYNEIKKYYKEEVVGEYLLAIGGKYEI